MNFSYKDLSFINEAISLQGSVYEKELANDICYLDNLLVTIKAELLNL